MSCDVANSCAPCSWRNSLIGTRYVRSSPGMAVLGPEFGSKWADCLELEQPRADKLSEAAQ
jgi:hypothetical protein